jgi:hypothetical protein
VDVCHQVLNVFEWLLLLPSGPTLRVSAVSLAAAATVARRLRGGRHSFVRSGRSRSDELLRRIQDLAIARATTEVAVEGLLNLRRRRPSVRPLEQPDDRRYHPG